VLQEQERVRDPPRCRRVWYSLLWTWDHLYAIYGDPDQDYFESPSVLVLAA
jgi:hypothetical protein